jgi:DNA-binding HxlR family transcriptional regulator
MVHSFTGEEIEDEISEELDEEYIAPNNLNEEELNEFLSKKGATELLILLAKGPKPFKRLNDIIPVSRTTVSNRLSEGVSLGLWGEDILYFDDNKKVKLYRLGSEVNELVDILTEKDAYESYMSYIRAKNEYENLTDNIRAEIEERILE